MSLSNKMKNRYTHPAEWSRLEQFEVGELVRCDTAGHIDSPHIVLIERRAAGLVWNALFPSGAVLKVTWTQLSKID